MNREEFIKSVKELGIDLVDLPDDSDKAYPISRMVNMDSSKTTFEDWLEVQDEKTKIDVLGKTRFKLYQDGIKINQFVDNGKVLTIEQLNEKLEE